nr:hypothetical protein [Clostridia bacterium]
YRDRLLCEFSEGDLFNFYPSDNTNVVELRADTAVSGESMMYAAALCDNPREYMGVSSIYTTPLVIKNSDYFTIKLKAEAPNGVENVSVMLRLFSDNGTTYEGIGQIREGVWSNVTFDISALSDKVQTIDGLKLWIKPYEGSSSPVGSYALWLDNITIQEKGGFTIGSFLITLLVLILLGGAAIGIYFYIRKRSENVNSPQAMKQRAAAYANRAPQPQQNRIPNNTQGTTQFNKLGTLSSDEEFRAAYGDGAQGRQQVRNMQAQQQMQNQQYRQPMQGQQMNGQMPNNQRRPMQNQYRQPMNGQPMQGQQMQQPMNGQPQMNNYQAQHRQYRQQGNMTMPMQNQQMQGQPNQMPYQQGQVQFRTNAQGQVRRQVNRQPMQNRYAQPMPSQQMNPNMNGQPMQSQPMQNQQAPQNPGEQPTQQFTASQMQQMQNNQQTANNAPTQQVPKQAPTDNDAE